MQHDLLLSRRVGRRIFSLFFNLTSVINRFEKPWEFRFDHTSPLSGSLDIPSWLLPYLHSMVPPHTPKIHLVPTHHLNR